MPSIGPRTLTPYLERLDAAPRILVAFSGGLDSTVLLHLAADVLPPDRLVALHVNHGMSPNSDDWESACRRFCDFLGIAFITRRVVVEATGEGVEQAARRARYRCFEREMEEGNLLLMAHHRDDQVETVLYRLLRGAGPRGLAGMPAERALGAGSLLRPLLHRERRELERYAREHQLGWVEDESNHSLAFDRNYLRHRGIPVLAERWPDYRHRLVRSADECADASFLLAERAREDLAALAEQSVRPGWRVSLADFVTLGRERRLNLLRQWVRERLDTGVGHGVLMAVLENVVPARPDARPRATWPGGEFRRFGDGLYLLPPLPPPPAHDSVLYWDGAAELGLPGGSALRLVASEAGDFCPPPGETMEVRFRRGGERCRPAGRAGSAPLKKLLQAYELPPWLRERVPLVYVGERLAAVGDLFVCEGFQAPTGSPGWRLEWLRAV